LARGNPGSGGTPSVAVCDLNPDNDEDVVASTSSLDYGATSLSPGHRNASFAKLTLWPEAPTSFGSARAVIDVNRDGNVDILIDGGARGARLVVNALR